MFEKKSSNEDNTRVAIQKLHLIITSNVQELGIKKKKNCFIKILTNILFFLQNNKTSTSTIYFFIQRFKCIVSHYLSSIIFDRLQ